MAAAAAPPRNVAFEEENLPLSHDSSTASRPKFITHTSRTQTDLDSIETRAFRHTAIIKRPRALHYKRIDDIDSEYPLVERKLTRPASSGSGSSGGDREERSTDDLLKQISRLDLFGQSDFGEYFRYSIASAV